MGIEKYFSVGKRVAAAVGLVAALSACETFFEVPKQAAEEVVRMAYTLATLPSEIIIPELKREPLINGCVETPKEKVCRLYLKKSTPEFGEEEYFGVLKIKKGFFGDNQQRLILGYWDEDKITRGWGEENEGEPLRDEEKYLVVVVYEGKNSEEFIDPDFGNSEFSYIDFKKFFDKPRANTLDTGDNPLKNLTRKNLIDAIQLSIFREELHEKIGIALKLADEQLPKSNE